MQIQQKHIRVILAIIFSLFISLFGVFIFSDFIYRGLTIGDDIGPLIQSGVFNTFFQGLYFLIGSGFQANWFHEFSSENIQLLTFSGVLFGETIWPAILTWFTAGLIGGILVKGVKRGLFYSLILFGSIFLLWLITGMFAGEDFNSMFMTNIVNTLGELFTVFVFLNLGGLLGGLISGPANFD